MVTRKIIVDFMRQSKTNSLEIKQGNELAMGILFVLMYDGKPFDMSDVELATVKGIAPNKSIIYLDAEIREDEEGNKSNVILFSLPVSMTGLTGQYVYEISLMDENGGTLTSFDFYVYIRSQLYDESDVWAEGDISAVRSYLARALRAAKSAENIEKSFEIAYGTISEISEALQSELEEYISYLDYLQRRVDNGEFNGARGPQGENGADAVVSEAGFLYGCQIVDGSLVIYYSNSESTPPFYINDDGALCIDVEEGD